MSISGSAFGKRQVTPATGKWSIRSVAHQVVQQLIFVGEILAALGAEQNVIGSAGVRVDNHAPDDEG